MSERSCEPEMNDVPEREITVFNAALQLTPAQRPTYLKAACDGDTELCCRVEMLIQAHESAGAFLEEPASDPKAPGVVFRPPVAPSEICGGHVGRYKLLQQIGEGGCGIVYLAEQEAPVRRRVALKVIKLGMDTKNVIARFEAERQALALMDHPNIAKVFDAGATETGRPFFAMELIRGVKLTDYCDQNKLPTRQRIDLFIQVCRAVQHAHQKGIIHRDLKPSNILVTVSDGVPVPKVIDFGIAKATQGRLTDQTLFTTHEQLIGTPAYMSPEQAIMTSVDVDTRSDIYSLGVLLYELLTGRTPFDHKELLEGGLEVMRRIVREKEPIRPSTRLSTMAHADLAAVAQRRQSDPPRLIHGVRGDLDWIVMKCLEKDRGRRYETANGLAMDVERFLANEPIVARPPSNLYRFQKLIRRNRLAVTAAAAVVSVLVIGLGFSTWQFVEKSKAEREQSRLREQAQNAQAEEARSRRRAEAQELAALKKAYASDMILLQQALAAEDLGRAQELLNRQRPGPGQPDLRGWEWRYFWQFCQSDGDFTLCQRSNSIISVSFSSDGALLAVGTYLVPEVTVWNTASREMIFRNTNPRRNSSRLAFAPAGSLLAFYDIADDGRSVTLWDSATRTVTHRLPLSAALRNLEFTRDGRLFTFDSGESNNVIAWDVASGSVVAKYTAGTPRYDMGEVFSVTGDGNQFIHVRKDLSDSVSLVEANGSHASSFRVADELTTALEFAPDGRTVITGAGYAEGAIKLWNLPNRKLAGSLDGHRSWVSCLKVLPDGKTLASASADRTVRLWDLETRRPIRTLRGHGGELWTLDASPDGRWLASGGKDGSVIVWDLTSSTNRPPAYRTLPKSGIGWWYPSPDGRLLSVLRQKRLELYDAATLQLVSEPALTLTNITGFAFSPDMRLLVVTDAQGNLGAWDRTDQRMITNFVAHPGGASLSPVFVGNGKSILSFGAEQVFKEWDAVTWSEIHQWPVESRVNTWAASPSVNLVAAGGLGGAFELIPLHDSGARRRFTVQNRIKSVDLSLDGKTFAAASENGTLELWDTETLTRRALLRGVLLGYHSVAISPDGERVVAGSNGQEAIKIWDVHSLDEVATLQGEGSFFVHAAFTPDGNTIGAVNWKGVIHLWTAPSWKEIESAENSRTIGGQQVGRMQNGTGASFTRSRL